MKPGMKTSLRSKPKEHLRTKEILSFTNAAVQALTDPTVHEEQQPVAISSSSKQDSFAHVNASSSDPSFSSHQTSLSSDQRAVLKLGFDASCSSSSSGPGSGNRTDLSSLDNSFNRSAAIRVRVPSRILREIKPQLDGTVDRSGVAVSSGQQPTPKVVRHINGPSAWVSMTTSSPVPEHEDITHRVPISTTTVSTHEITQAKDLDTEWEKNQPILPQSSFSQPKEPASKEVKSCDQPQDLIQPLSSLKGRDGIGLRQGEPVTGLFTGYNSRQDSVKGKSFVLSQREQVLKEEFMKRQDRRSAAIKRSVQPTIITRNKTEKSNSNQEESQTTQKTAENSVANAAAVAAAAASVATAPFLQVDARLRKLEELQQQLLNTQGYRENPRLMQSYGGYPHFGAGLTGLLMGNGFSQASHMAPTMIPVHPEATTAHDNPPLPGHQPFMHQQPLQNQSIPSHLERQVQNPLPSDIPQSSLTHQTKPNQPIPWHMTIQHGNPASSTGTQLSAPAQTVPPQTTSNPQDPVPVVETLHRTIPVHTSANYQTSTSYNIPRKQPFSHQPVEQPPSTMATTGTVYTQTLPTPYVPAKTLLQHETSSNLKTVKNSKTQTSPQDSSISSSESPLQTPLPRKKPPRPTPHSYSKDGLKYSELPTRQKRVHFHQLGHHDPFDTNYTPKEYTDQQRIRGSCSRHMVRTDKSYPQTTSTVGPMTRVQENPTSSKDLEEVMGELSKMRSDLRNVLTETEKMKSGLTQQRISKEVDNMLSHRTKEPSLLDNYLTKPVSRPAVRAKPLRMTAPFQDSACADIKQVLKEVETQRNNLEYNLDAVIRQNEEENLYSVVDAMMHGAQGAEAIHVRQIMDKMITEMNTAVRKEIDIESRKAQTKAEVTPTTDHEKLKPKSKSQAGRKVPGKSSTLAGQHQKNPGKENVLTRIKEKKMKNTHPTSTTKSTTRVDSKPVSKPVYKPVSKPVSSGTSQTYLTSIYGWQPYHAQRTTSKAPYLHYQSPINPRTAALTMAIQGAGKQYQSNPPHPQKSQPIRERTDKPNKEWDHLRSHLPRSQFIPAGDGRVHVNAPLEGRKMPMAIPLGKPRMDPSLRLPLPTTATETVTAEQYEPVIIPSQSTPVQPPVKSSPSKSNVAVITIKHEGLEDESTRKRRRTEGTRKQPDLAVQVLPQMDVDSLTESSEEILRYDTYNTVKPTPVTRPADVEYEDFRNYLAVKDTVSNQDGEDDEEDATPRIPTPENPLTIKGHSEKDHLYHGPPFPPEHPPLPSNPPSGVLDADKRVRDTVEDRAMEWVEQELLARIVSEMNLPLPDPTLLTRPPQTPDSSEASDDGEILAATIGLGGVQLFVDAGIPVDRDLVAELIRDVVAEQISSTLGYPKPTASPRQPMVEAQDNPPTPEPVVSPVSTPLPTPVYTPAESESSFAEPTKVATPDLTPTTSTSSVTIETEEEPTPVKEVNEVEDESEPEVSMNQTPVATPIATPTISQSPIASVSTPEPSTQEHDVTDVGIPVLTPDPSISVPSTSSVSICTPPVESSATPPPPKPPTPVTTNSPSTISASTLSPSTTSTMTTIDEELSEGQLLQPYVHGGPYSEGEYVVNPDVVQLARDRNLPMETVEILGKDQDSRNELIRIALHGLLRRGLYSTSSIDTTSVTSHISTLKDAHDISKDSLVDYSHSDGEVVFPRDPVPVFRGPHPSANDHPATTQYRSKASPGELSPTAFRSSRGSSPGEVTTRRDQPRTPQSTTPTGRVIPVTPNSSPEQRRQTPRDHSDSRSLHKSDLQHQGGGGTRTSASSRESSTSPQKSPQGNQFESPRQSTRGSRPRDNQPASRPPIHVTIPPVDEYDSSGYSKERHGYELGDTSGDISSISGGDF